jgi:hypothetical protein
MDQVAERKIGEGSRTGFGTIGRNWSWKDEDLRVRYSKTAIHDSISIIASSTVGTPCPPPVV